MNYKQCLKSSATVEDLLRLIAIVVMNPKETPRVALIDEARGTYRECTIQSITQGTGAFDKVVVNTDHGRFAFDGDRLEPLGASGFQLVPLTWAPCHVAFLKALKIFGHAQPWWRRMNSSICALDELYEATAINDTTSK